MAADPTVIAALEAAISSDPTNVALRVHVAKLLLEANDGAAALAHISHVLASQPDHRDAILLGAEAADLVGDKIKAHGYRKLAEAMGWQAAMNLIGNEEPPEFSRPPRQAADGLEEEVEAEIFEASLDESPDMRFEMDRPTIDLKAVAGMADVKKRLELAFLGPMRNPDLRKLYGKSLRGGLLLYGPPGCGKTYVARAVAGELGAKFLPVGLTDVVDMWIGQSEKNLHELFGYARRNTPCVVFFDEIDALGHKRSLMRGHAGRTLINQLLSEMDGVQNDNEGLFVLAATNHPWDVDSALRRPGRLDRTLLVLPPDSEARAAIFRMNLEARPTEGIDYALLANKTENYSGADIAHVCESAAELALARSLDTGTVSPIGMRELTSALKETRASTGAWFDTAKNHAVFANEGGIYDDLVAYMKGRKLL